MAGLRLRSAERRRKAERAAAKLRKKGVRLSPVTIEGRKIATTFWGKAWCDNLESYRDYENRLERGRTYVRNGSVVDLQIAPHEVTAMVSGSAIYNVKITHRRGAEAAVEVDLRRLRGRDRLAGGTAARAVFQGRDGADLPPGHRPVPEAAGDPILLQLPGLRLDVQARRGGAVWASARGSMRSPELLFRLRGVDENDLVADIGVAADVEAGSGGRQGAGSRRYGGAVRPGHGRGGGSGPSRCARRGHKDCGAQEEGRRTEAWLP